MLVDDFACRKDHEISAQLPSILPASQLRELSVQRPSDVGLDYIWVQIGPEERTPLETHQLVGVARGVTQELEGAAQTMSHLLQTGPVIEPNDEDRDSVRGQLLVVSGHLHEMAFAEKSADVTEKNENCYLVRHLSELKGPAIVPLEGVVHDGGPRHLSRRHTLG